MKKTSADELAGILNISKARAQEAIIKAGLIGAVIKTAEKERLTHAEIAKRAGLHRSVVTGILSGSLRKVTLDRIIRLAYGAGLEIRVTAKRAA